VIYVVRRPKKHFPSSVGATYSGHGQTYTQIYIHVIFAVESRQSLIGPEHNDELQKYITGIIAEQRHKLIAINNMPDHLHALIGMRPDAALSDLVNDMKTGSSKFINGKRWVMGRFSWQHGFGAFSHSRSQLGTVVRYIQNQPQQLMDGISRSYGA